MVLICCCCLHIANTSDACNFQSVFRGISRKPTLTPTGMPSEFPLRCATGNLKQTCPENYPIKHNPTTNPDRPSNLTSTCPSYFQWIHDDLRHWKETGITQDMIERARKTAHFRLVIVNGKAYVEKYRQSIQTRDMFTLWGILQLLRLYPGRLPDLELMFDCDDRPVIPSKHFRGPNAAPPPLFRYCSDWQSLDIVFPDWSFWGWYVIPFSTPSLSIYLFLFSIFFCGFLPCPNN